MAIGGVLVVGASLLAASTRPFTIPADAVVSVALLAALIVVARQRVLARHVDLLGRRLPETETAGLAMGETRRWWPWVAAVAATVGFELFCLFSLPRSAHPTLSSMLDAADRSYAGHAVAFGGWLLLGWYLVTR